MELSVWDQPEDLNLFFTATCQDGVSYPDQRKCEGLKIGDTVSPHPVSVYVAPVSPGCHSLASDNFCNLLESFSSFSSVFHLSSLADFPKPALCRAFQVPVDLSESPREQADVSALPSQSSPGQQGAWVFT